MKRITVIIDGSADRPQPALGGKTPLEAAYTPNLDAIAARSARGLIRNIPEGMEIGSAVANMALLGLDPGQYKGRAAIEAAGSGLALRRGNLYARMNFVTFTGPDYDSAVISSYDAGELPTAEAEALAELLKRDVFAPPYHIYNVGTFRNILEVDGGGALWPLSLAPAHDIIGKDTAAFQHGEKEAPFYELQRRAYEALRGNPTAANGVWFWGDSLKPEFECDGRGRCVLSETILMRGITAIAGLENIPTDEELPFCGFLGEKVKKALDAAERCDRLYIHVQATDDLSHERDPLGKKAAIESVDKCLIGPLAAGLKGDFILAVCSDHFTFSDSGSHGGEPTPLIVFDSTAGEASAGRFTEASCAETGLVITAPELVELMESRAS